MRRLFRLTLETRPRPLRDAPRTGGSQPVNIRRINRRYSVPSVPGKTHAKITPEMTTPEEVDNRQYISVSRRRNMSTLERRSIPAHGVAFARRTPPVRLAQAPRHLNFVNLSLRRDTSAGRRLPLPQLASGSGLSRRATWRRPGAQTWRSRHHFRRRGRHEKH